MRKCKKWNEEDLEQLRMLYSDLSNREIASVLGRTEIAVKSMASKHSLKKNSERLREAQKAMHEREAQERGTKKRLALIWSDRRRWKNGLEQRTAFKFSMQTKQKRNYRTFLRKHGYKEKEGHKNVIYYDENTRRVAKSENFAWEKYHIKTLPL